MWENSAAAFPIQGRRLGPHVEVFSNSLSVLLFSFRVNAFFLPPEMRANFWGFIFFLLWLLMKSQNCVEEKFTSGSNPLPYIPIHRAASSNIVLSRNSDMTWNISNRLSNESCGCFFCLFVFINLKDAQINISHKHCTFIGQNKPSELHVSTFQVDEKNNTDLFFLWFWMLGHFSKNYSKCLIYLNINNCHNSIIISVTVTQKGRRSMFYFFLGAVLWIVRAVILSLFCRAYVG